MVEGSHYHIGGVKIEISSDTVLPTTKSPLFEKFRIKSAKSDARYTFFELKQESFVLGPLKAAEKKALRRTLKFPERWEANPVFRAPAVRAAVQQCLREPELAHLSLSWNRLIIRNFAWNEFNFFYYPENRAEMSDPLFNARFRNLLGLSLVNHSGFLLHGAGALNANGAVLFLAPDEGGKTTLIKKFPVNKILSDDQVVLRLVGNDLYLCGTPFGTMSCGPSQAKLGAIFMIKKSKKFGIFPANANDVLRFIWNESFFGLMVFPKTLRLRIFDLVCQACRQVPGYYIHAPVDSLDFEAIDRAMAV